MTESEVIERQFRAPLAVVWDLWTTAEGLSSWWGPKGFRVEVQEFDLRIGGAFRYRMHAESEAMKAMMLKRGQPAIRDVSAVIIEVEPMCRVAWRSAFGEEALVARAEFTEADGMVSLVLTVEATMPGMTAGAAGGWKSALGKLEARLAG